MNSNHWIQTIKVHSSSLLQSYNFYLVQNKDHLFLIDSGVNREEAWEFLHQTLKKHKLSLTDLDGILLTHHHNDHTGLINRILSKHRVPIYAHSKAIVRMRRDLGFLENRIIFFEKMYLEMGCEPKTVSKEISRLKQSIIKNESEKIIEEINVLQEGDAVFGLQVIEVPGHAPDHVAFYDPHNKTAFLGDLIIKNIHVNALVDMGEKGERMQTLIDYEKSLNKMQNYEMKIAYSGHGDIIDNPHQVIEKKLAHIHKRSKKIVHLLDTLMTPAEIAKILYKEKYETQFPLVMSEVIGHIDRLEKRDEIQKEVIAGINHYVNPFHFTTESLS